MPRSRPIAVTALYVAMTSIVAASGLSAVAVPAAVAQPASDRTAAAEALFEQGRQLMAAGKLAEACDKFEASHRIEPSIGALLNLANCREQNGQIASAWAGFRRAAALARKTGDRKRQRYATSRAKKLAPRLPYLIIEVPEEARVPGLTVTRNGAAVADALWDQRAPVDPGEHTVTARAPGHRPYTVEVEVEGAGDPVRVTIPALIRGSDDRPDPDQGDRDPVTDHDGSAGGAIGPPGPGGPPGPIAPAEPTDPIDGPGLGARRKIAIGVFAVGVAGLAAGTVVGLRANSTYDEARAEHCGDDDLCSAEGVALVDDAKRLGTVANVAFGIAGVAAVTAAVLWLTGGPSDRAGDDRARSPLGTSDRVVVTPALGPGAIGFDMTVRF